MKERAAWSKNVAFCGTVEEVGGVIGVSVPAEGEAVHE